MKAESQIQNTDSEIFPPGYTPYRADRVSKTTRSGGVFVLVRDTLICSEQPQLRSECEITWVKLEIVVAQPLYLAAYYKPSEDDQDSLDMLRNSLEKLTGKKGNIMVVGDINLIHVIPPGSPGRIQEMRTISRPPGKPLKSPGC